MKPVGYAALIDRYDLKGPRPWHLSGLDRGARNRVISDEGITESYAHAYDPGESDLDHLVFALKYDGCDLRLLKAFLPIFNEGELVEALHVQTHSMPLRRLWFLFEWLTSGTLPIADLATGNYIELLDSDRYVTAPLFRSPRHRVMVNTLGLSSYCPMVRRTAALSAFAAKDLQRKAGSLIQTVDAMVLARATTYLYLKESRTSWDIERVEPSQRRMARFLGFLHQPTAANLGKAGLVAAHNAIVDPDMFETGYRQTQVYVADGPRIDYIAPKPEDVGSMMEALMHGVDHDEGSDAVIQADFAAMNGGRGRGKVMRAAVSIDPVIHAALVGFGFVYIHPFNDGNGRMHRYLLQRILGPRQYSPPDFMIPISPSILRDRSGYLRTLETVSDRIMPFVDHARQQNTGKITVRNATADLYRYPDLTPHCEYLYQKIEDAIERDVHSELVYLQTYDRAKLRAQLVRRLPDAQEQALLQLCFTEGRISGAMRAMHFHGLDPAVLDALEQVVVQTINECPLPRSLLEAQALEQNR